MVGSLGIPARGGRRWWMGLALLATLLVGMVARSGPAGAALGYGAASFSSSGPGTTNVTTPAPGSGPQFNYASTRPDDFSLQTWTYQATATATQTLSYDWAYSFFHAFFKVTAKLDAFADGPTGRTTVHLVDFFNDFYTGGQFFEGSSSLAVTSGYAFGFIVQGGNRDSNRTLQGSVAIGPFASSLGTVQGSATYGGTATLTATLARTFDSKPLAGRTVNFTLGGNPVGNAVTNGSGVATLSGVPLGAYGAGSHPGAVGASFAADSSYLASSATGPLVVNKATLTVTADNQSRPYGDANPTLTASFTGFVNGQTLATSDVTGSPALSTAATPSSPASGSPYAITAAVGTLASNNYALVFVNGQLTVTQASLTVTANPASKVYTAPNPAFSVTLSGFKNGEDAASASVSGSAALATSATQSSPAGTYAIVPSLGSLSAPNYTFGPFVNGTLTVTKAATRLTQVRGAVTYGDTTGSVTATLRRTDGDSGPVVDVRVRFLVNGVAVCGGGGQPNCPKTNAQGVATLSGVAFAAGLQGGSYANVVQARFNGDDNHLAAENANGPLVVARRILWIKSSDRTVGFQQPNPATTPPAGCALVGTPTSACWLELASGTTFAPGEGWANLNLTSLRFAYSRNYPDSNASEFVGKTYKIAAIGASSTNYEIHYQLGILTVGP